ncbi:MAG: hypothetical protein M0P91_04190 [Sulfuricurvum sp.]|jgi:hypothetical protein|uniref:hypothetical protein n=1 Tax=Sulfuricurvum sp. TaxID=2025608 RepID=UPI0025FE6A58|nr:hypothetical protein [Sulfuricurvum sp.]MCK9372373.1 hypothetical protein [Sulfuricurvum sp.]
MKDKNTNLAAVMQFAGICSSEYGNKTIQELKEEVVRAKYYENNKITASFHQNLQKIKDADKSIIEDFENTVIDGLD